MQFGKLNLKPVKEGLELLSAPVRAALEGKTDDIWVAAIDPSLSDTQAFCEHYQVPLEATVNCIVLEAKRADKKWLAACGIQGELRADINGVVRKILEARRVSFAPREQAVEESQMEFGAITPIGLPKGWAIVLNESILDQERVVVGSGLRHSKLILAPALLVELSGAQICNIAKKQE